MQVRGYVMAWTPTHFLDTFADGGDVVADISHTMWTHGTSMNVQFPDRLNKMVRAGWGIDLESPAGSENWFHFAIPTPVVVSDRRLRVGSVLVDFETGSTEAVVNHVHVWDARRRIAEHNNLNLFGQVGVRRFEVPDSPPVWEGIGVSIGVGFGVEPYSRQMKFFSAGADFLS